MIIYQARCRKCDCELEVVKCYLDNDSDLCIEVGPCEDCLCEARSEGKAAGMEEASNA